jgi:hypothetical protein
MGRQCDTGAGRCVPTGPTSNLVSEPKIGGQVSTNAQGRTHIGRVAVVPVVSVAGVGP